MNFLRRLNTKQKRYARRVTDRQTDKYHKNEAFPLVNVFNDMCTWAGDHFGLT